MELLFAYLFLALGVSFLCSMLEAVLLSVNPSYVAVKEKEGHKFGLLLRQMKDNIDRPLAAILSLNTIAHTVGAAGVGSQAQVVFGSAYVSVISAILTLLILVISEIIPKSLGANYWRSLAPVSARILQVLVVTMYPLVLLSQGITKLLSRGKKGPLISREEFSAMAEVGAEEGVFEEEETRIFKNLVRFNSLRVKDIMTPRIVVEDFEESVPIGEVFEDVDEIRFSRLPVYEGKRDNVTGYVLKNDLLIRLARGESDTMLKDVKREVLIVPVELKLSYLFERLLRHQEHLAVAVDEYGGFAGVVTMEDVVETLLGMEIVDEVDNIEDMQKMARRQWKERAKRLGITVEQTEQESSS